MTYSQGCEAQATLGNERQMKTTPTGVVANCARHVGAETQLGLA
jgi:hypothetical protein